MPSSKANEEKPERLQFNVSSGLKSILGSELITDDEVAVFELVKNSFDAGAKRVDLFFNSDQIVVSDNGCGMSLEDVKAKWLFVAFSSKRDASRQDDFRDDIAGRVHYAGSKGIGRFSSDRLGRIVNLQTKPESESSKSIHSVTIDWALFDKDHQHRFEEVDVQYEAKPNGFDLPDGLPKLKYGTVITVRKPKHSWNRKKILELKAALAKLINPFGSDTDNFRIFLHAPDETERDVAAEALAKKKAEEIRPNELANGEVGNFIFARLQEKTTYLDVKIVAKDNSIESALIDRGELIYRIREANPYQLLTQSGFQCRLFFLNASAKNTFSRRMGVQPINFGSVFLFRNGFRVYPIGERGDDWFQMDQRKQQGFARYLGTRDLIGRIDVFGSDENFQEASSRNAGLISTSSVIQLQKCFTEHCLKRLEKYVVPVTFVDKEDKNVEDISRLLTDPGRARVTEAVARLIDTKGVELIDYSHRLVSLIDERSSQFEESLKSLRAIAETTKDRKLFANIEEAEKRFKDLREAEEAARKQADEERAAKEAAQERAKAAEQKATDIEEKFLEERKRSMFLSSIATLDTETILNLHHQVTIYAVNIQQQIENFLLKISDQRNVATTDIVDALGNITLLNRKVLGIAKFATKANFRLESEAITADLGTYIEQYINSVAKDFPHGSVKRISVVNPQSAVLSADWTFKPIDVSVVVDNLIANAKKAKATAMDFEITRPTKDSLYIKITDNGQGLHKSITDGTRIFEKGFSKTDGSGLGLYHVKQVLGEMNGTIELLPDSEQRGVTFLVKISK